MRANEFLNEVQSGVWREIRSMMPKHWPDYIVKDWIYTRLQEPDHANMKREYIDWVLKKYPVRQWKLEMLDLGYHSFDGHTQEVLTNRISQTGGAEHMSIPRDQERHEIQANIIKKTGQANQEPIIVIARKDGYELLEGWHRTIQNILAFPNGWRSKAWVGYI